MKITLVAGARPNFVKIAPILNAIQRQVDAGQPVSWRLVHTGQHFDKKMSGDFFEQLGIPEPHANLGAGGGSQAEQTAAIMVSFEQELIAHTPDVVLVVGDVTSTMACTITAKKLCIAVVHVEGGIRSGDMTMPEEINRIVTDAITDHFFTTTEVANQHLRDSGVPDSRIHLVGNTMIDTLLNNMDRLRKPEYWERFQLRKGQYFMLTLHRPANVDKTENLEALLQAILKDTGDYPILFPVHPRTKAQLERMNFNDDRLLQIDPLGYHEFNYLVKNSKAIITDSGGITEEATVMGVPCLTLRDTTERPETVTIGTNVLVGTRPEALAPYLQQLLEGHWKQGGIPALWDGKTSERIVEKLLSIYKEQPSPALS